MLREPRRLLSSALAILLGVAFTAATLLLGASLSRSYADQVAGRAGEAAVIVESKGEGLPADLPDAISALPGVTGVRPLIESGRFMGSPEFYVQILTLPAGGETVPTEGRLPAAPGEVVINKAMKDAGHLSVGQRLAWDDAPASTVVGVVDVGRDTSAFPGQPTVLGSNETLLPLASNSYALIMVNSGGDAAELATRIGALPSVAGDKTASAVTARAWIDDLVKQYTADTGIVTGVLLTFGVIAFFVAALVISNTFSILVAQRTRQLALLRCLGASRGQTFRQVVGEAALTAALAGAVGLAAGIGLVSLLPVFAPAMFAPGTVRPDAVSLVVPWLAGIAVTVAAAIVPARAATRVAPLAALRPMLAPRAGRPIGIARTVIGALLFVAGAGLLVVAALTHELVAGLAGGVLNFTGVLLVAPWWIPAAAGLLGRPFGRDVVGRLAVENTRRNPRRAAATAGALLIGTTLVTMVLTGASVAQATVDAANARRYPADVMISGDVDAGLLGKLAGTPGVAAAVRVPAVTVTLEGGKTPDYVTLMGLTPADAEALGWSAASDLRDDQIALSGGFGIPDGGRAVLRTEDDRRVDVTAKLVPQASLTVVTPALVNRLTAEPQPLTMVKFAPGADSSATLGAINAALADHQNLRVASAQAEKEMMAQTFTTVLLVVLGLLAVSVLISLVGVGNTLALSVLERGRETALLRALGLDRTAVRRLLGGEALLLGAVAAVVGIALGLGYGIAGIATLMNMDAPLVLAVPWAQLALVVAITLGCAWLASVVPAKRAAAVPPAAALAQE